MSDEYIYTLIDPRDDAVRYVGRTQRPEERYKGHLMTSSGNGAKDFWIAELLELSLMPRMNVIEHVSNNADWRLGAGQREKYWINYYRDRGANLFNKVKPEGVSRFISFEKNLDPSVDDGTLTLEEENKMLRSEVTRLKEIVERITQILAKDIASQI